MKHSVYNHCAGTNTVPAAIQDEIAQIIGTVKVKIAKGASGAIRDAIINKLIEKGWSKPVSVSMESEMTITSTKTGVGLCLQTGNMARIYADLLKLQKLYMDNAITSAVVILPSQPLAKILGDNIVHANRLERELEIFRKVIHIPIMLFVME